MERERVALMSKLILTDGYKIESVRKDVSIILCSVRNDDEIVATANISLRVARESPRFTRSPPSVKKFDDWIL